ncbi:MAG: sugar ABC transporter permease [Anaerolineae bacterium]|nr:sugar ABC transporter permease [Anaerolineae bacterium]
MHTSLEKRAHRRGSGLRAVQVRFALTGAVPALAYYILFRFYPLGSAFYMSLFDWKLLRKQQSFVGLANYREVLADPLTWKIVGNTAYFALASTAIGLTLALITALLLSPIGRGSSVIRLLYFLPQMTSVIAVATIWKWLYQDRFGLINQILQLAGMPAVNWLSSPRWAMPSIIIMSVWGSVGYSTVIFLAGLRNIPISYYEAAAMDGASGVQMAWHITLPLLSPVISFSMITGLIGGFNVFQQVYMLTRGGPLNSTRTIALQIYDYAFGRQWMGKAAVLAYVLFAIVMLLTLLQLQLNRKDVEL